MTALNAFKQRDAAYLLTDTAHYDGQTGTVLELGPKAMELSSFPAAIAHMGTGGFDPDILIRRLSAADPASVDDLLRLLPNMLRRMRAEADRKWPGDRHEWALAVAAFSYRRGRPEVYRCDTFSGWLSPDYEPFTLREMTAAMSAGEGVQLFDLFGRRVDVTDPASFNPRSDGLRILESARRTPMKVLGSDHSIFGVGGQAILTTVDVRGVHTEVLHTWPDVVGQPIKPAPAAASNDDEFALAAGGEIFLFAGEPMEMR